MRTQTAADHQLSHSHDLWLATTRSLRAFVARRVDPDDAEDVTQDILLRVLRSGRDAETTAATPGWLYTVARNAVIDHYRTRQRLDRLPPDLSETPDDPSDAGPSDAVREVAQCLLPAIAQLPEPYRRAVTVVDLEGMTQTKAAAIEGISVSGMKSRVQRGRRMLVDRLQEWCSAYLTDQGEIATRPQPCTCDDTNC